MDRSRGRFTLKARDLATGTLRWRYPDGGFRPPGLCGGVLFHAGQRDLYALDPASGRERWRVAVGVEIVTSPVCAGDLVVFGAGDGRFIAVRARPPRKLPGETPTRADQ